MGARRLKSRLSFSELQAHAVGASILRPGRGNVLRRAASLGRVPPCPSQTGTLGGPSLRSRAPPTPGVWYPRVSPTTAVAPPADPSVLLSLIEGLAIPFREVTLPLEAPPSGSDRCPLRASG